MVRETEVRFLENLGLTRSQAYLYLTLAKIGSSSALTLSKQTQTPRTEMYRLLDELEEIGLVEKHLDVPCLYEATPVRSGVESLLLKKHEEYERNRQELNKFLVGYEKSEKKQKVIEPKITLSKGKQKLLSLLKCSMDNVSSTVNFVTPMKRWLSIYENCQENIKNSLRRGVKYRGLLETNCNDIYDLHSAPALQHRTNLELRLVRNVCGQNFAVFDKREAAFNFSPGKSLKEAVTLWTNHPNLVAILEEQYEALWRKAEDTVLA